MEGAIRYRAGAGHCGRVFVNQISQEGERVQACRPSIRRSIDGWHRRFDDLEVRSIEESILIRRQLVALRATPPYSGGVLEFRSK